jgi:hypothetical protein
MVTAQRHSAKQVRGAVIGITRNRGRGTGEDPMGGHRLAGTTPPFDLAVAAISA